MRRTPALFVFLAVAACSGGGDDRLSAAEYVRRADEVCATYDRRLEELPRPEDLADLADLADRALPIAEEGVRELRKLEPPKELERPVNEWLERNDANVEKIEELREAARAGDEQRVQILGSEARKNEEEADALARRIGLRTCAEAD